jgi:hypothetical protein
MHRPCSLLLLLAATALVGCGDGPGLAGVPAAPGTGDAAASEAASPDGSGGAMDAGSLDALASDAGDPGTGDDGSDAAHLPPVCVPGGAHSGSRWQDLYSCYFGPTGIANCALNSSCHINDPSAAGAWVCGPSSDACYQGAISSGVVPDGGAMDPTMTTFYTALRTSDGFGGTMPLQPADVSFTPADMMRIATWIQSGALNN